MTRKPFPALAVYTVFEYRGSAGARIINTRFIYAVADARFMLKNYVEDYVVGSLRNLNLTLVFTAEQNIWTFFNRYSVKEHNGLILGWKKLPTVSILFLLSQK